MSDPVFTAPLVPGLISVVVPVYDGERWLAEALDSVLAQTYQPIEVIAVDDGSRDRSPVILERYPAVRVIRRRNGGCAVARNIGLLASRGEAIAFIDQDDRWMAGKLERQMELLRSRPDVGHVLGRQSLFLEPGCPMPPWLGSRHRLFEQPHVGYLPGTMVVRRRTFELVGTFDEGLRLGSDSDWLIRARDAGVQMAYVDDVVIEKRIHDGNLSSDPEGSFDMLVALGRSIRRRRSTETQTLPPSGQV